MILPDIIEPGLRVVFCGTAAGTKSAETGSYYAGPGNLFWSTLHEVGFTPRLLQPSEARLLPEWGIGLTDICKIRSGSDADVGREGFDVNRLVATIERYQPTWIAFNGKNAAQAAAGHRFQYGQQPERLGAAGMFVLPSTSGLARGFWNIEYWRELAQLA